jgi:hypothetical protein
VDDQDSRELFKVLAFVAVVATVAAILFASAVFEEQAEIRKELSDLRSQFEAVKTWPPPVSK